MRRESKREREGERARERGKRWTRTSHRLKRMGTQSIFVKHSHVVIRRPLLEVPKYARWISGSLLSLESGHCFGREACVTLGSDCISVEEMLMRSPQSLEGASFFGYPFSCWRMGMRIILWSRASSFGSKTILESTAVNF